MKKGSFFLLAAIGGLIFIAAIGAWIGLSKPDSGIYRADVIEALASSDSTIVFEQAKQVRSFVFPQDFGPHPTFQTEWWYYTGNLKTIEGRHFGYQLTIFRRALNRDLVSGSSKWRTNQVYFGHFALTDVLQNQFYSFEKFSRGALGLAGSQGIPYKVWIENWQIYQDGDEYILQAADKDVGLKLTMKSQKPIVLQGDGGLSQKSQDVGNASYYYSQTRLLTKGFIEVGSSTFDVSGYSWLDREWSTSAFKRGESGWDWFAVQLDDHREIMLYQIRYQSGTISPYSSGSYIDQAGKKHHLDHEAFKIKPTGYWKSPETGVVFPAAWNIEIPSFKLSLTVVPHINGQEHRHSFNYWEGAVKVTSGKVKGQGYVELTGYTKK